MTPTDENRPLRYWCVGPDVLTTVEEAGAKAIVHLTTEDLANLDIWFKACPDTQDAIDFFAAIKRRDEWRRIAFAH